MRYTTTTGRYATVRAITCRSIAAWDIVNGYYREPRYPVAPEPTVERHAVLEIEIEPIRNPLDLAGILVCLAPVVILLLMLLPFILRHH